MEREKLKNKYLLYIILTVLLAGSYWFLAVSQVRAARLYFQPSRESLNIGKSSLVELRLDTEDEYINAGEITITYPQSLLLAANFFDASSIFDIFITRPTITTEGEIFLSGGTSAPFNGDGLILKIAFLAEAEGQATVGISAESKILVADGQGSIANLKSEPVVFVISSLTGGITGVDSPVVSSPTHPNPIQFYSSNQVVVTWELTDDYEYSYTFSKLIEIPDDEPEERVSSVSFFDVEDGIYFFNLKAINIVTGQAGSTVNFRIMIDTTPPENVKISVEKVATGSVVAVVFSDKTSGVEALEFKVKGQDDFQKSESQFFVVDNTEDITIRVYDKAGNFTERTFRVSDATKFYLIVIILLVVAALIVYFLIQRQRHLKNLAMI